MGDIVSRRNVVGLAWTVPVLMLAVATPAAAASFDGSAPPAARNAVSLAGAPVIVTTPSATPRSFTQTGSISQLSGVAPAHVKITTTFTGTGGAFVVVPATAVVINNQFQFSVGFQQTTTAYTFSISVVPENDPSVEFLPGGNTVVISIPSFVVAPPTPPGGNTYTPPPPFGSPTSTPPPTSPGVNCEVHRVVPGVKANPNDKKVFCD